MRRFPSLSLALALMVLALTFSFLPAQTVNAQEASVSGADSKLGAFCGDFDRMDVSFVVDQSGSLKQTDPNKERRAAGRAYINNLAALPQDVSVNVSGFGDEFREGDWVSLNDEGGTAQAVDALDLVVDAGTQDHTDYVVAMQGALDTFEDRSPDRTCRVFVWFTDGRHDLGNPPDGKSRPYEDNLDEYTDIVGSENAPLLMQPINTEQDAQNVAALLDPLSCNTEGFGDQLVQEEIFSQVLLLDESGAIANDPSWKVIQRLTAGGDFCGTHGVEDPGDIIEVASIDELIWTLSCPPQVPGTVVQRVQGDAFPLTLDKVAPSVATGLITRVFVSALGEDGLHLAPNGSGTSTSSGSISGYEEEFTVESPPSLEWSVGAEPGAVSKACTSVTVGSPTAVAVGDDDLRSGEPGKYLVVVSGPFGPLTPDDLSVLTIEAQPGTNVSPEPPRWKVDLIPEKLEISGSIMGEGFDDVAFGPQAINVLPERGFPSIQLDEPDLVGEGPGPFKLPFVIDPGDGGKLCLKTSEISVTDEDGANIVGTVEFAGGGQCITDFENAPDELIVTFDDSGIVPDGNITLEFASESGERTDEWTIKVPTRLTRAANEAVRWVIFVIVVALILFMFWLVLYLVNRRSVRIPNLRNHRWYRFDAASPEALAVAMQSVDLNHTKRPKSSSGEFAAGPLVGRRHVPLVRVWRRPSIDLSLEGSEFSASISSRVRRSSKGKLSVTRGNIEKGHIVVLPDEGSGSSGVLFTTAPRAGSNAETEFLNQLTGGIRDIQRQQSH